MAELITIARPYAKALFEHALTGNTLKEWHMVMSILVKIISNRDMQLFIDHPKTTTNDTIDCLMKVMDADYGVPKQELQNWLTALVINNRISLAPYILELYETMQFVTESRVCVEVISAQNLDSKTLENIQVGLHKKFNQAPQIITKQDQSLIGGVVIKKGDKVIDGSILNRLRQLQQHMMSS